MCQTARRCAKTHHVILDLHTNVCRRLAYNLAVAVAHRTYFLSDELSRAAGDEVCVKPRTR